MTWPQQDTSCSNDYGDSDDEYEQVKCYGCDKLLVITITGGVYMQEFEGTFLCENCFHGSFQVFKLDLMT